MAELHRLVADAKAKSKPSELTDALVALGRELAAEDFDNAVRLLTAVADMPTKSALCRGAFEYEGAADGRRAFDAAIRLDPLSATAQAAQPGASRNRTVFAEALTAAMRGWASVSPSAAAAALTDVPRSQQLSMAKVVYGVWAAKDAPAAINSAAALDPEYQVGVLPAICINWAAQSPGPAWDYVAALPADTLPGQEQLLTSIATAWAEQDPSAAVAAIDRDVQDDKRYAAILDRMVQELSTKRPENAAALFASLPGLYERQPSVMTAAVRNWVVADAGAASEWATGVQLEVVRFMAIRTVATYWAMRDDAKALAWAQRITDDLAHAEALSSIAAQIGERKATAATDWMTSLPDEYTRCRVLASYVSARLRKAGDTSVATALGRLGAGEAMDSPSLRALVEASRAPKAEKDALLTLLQ